MTDEQKAAFINAQASIYNGRVAGMVAENQQRMALGNSVAYDEEAFIILEREYGAALGHNAVLVLFG